MFKDWTGGTVFASLFTIYHLILLGKNTLWTMMKLFKHSMRKYWAIPRIKEKNLGITVQSWIKEESLSLILDQFMQIKLIFSEFSGSSRSQNKEIRSWTSPTLSQSKQNKSHIPLLNFYWEDSPLPQFLAPDFVTPTCRGILGLQWSVLMSRQQPPKRPSKQI